MRVAQLDRARGTGRSCFRRGKCMPVVAAPDHEVAGSSPALHQWQHIAHNRAPLSGKLISTGLRELNTHTVHWLSQSGLSCQPPGGPVPDL